MLVLGIDPGSQCTGYGLLDDEGRKPRLVASGVIRTKRGNLALRLGEIAKGVEVLLAEYQPDTVAVEEVFGGKNMRSVMVLGQARGAALAAVGKAGLPVSEYATRRIKKSVTGNGAASKQQVRLVLEALLGQMPEQLDATDAVAVAMCHLQWSGGPTHDC